MSPAVTSGTSSGSASRKMRAGCASGRFVLFFEKYCRAQAADGVL